VSKDRFVTVTPPFSTVFRPPSCGRIVGFAALLPFSGARRPLENGETGENGDEAFALRHGMNPSGVVHALRRQR
jgi:hypothetical protein